MVEDPALLSFIDVAKAEGEKSVKALDEEVSAAAEAWKKSSKESAEVRTAAHQRYATAYTRKADVEGALAVGALTDAYIQLKAPDAILKVDPAPADADAVVPSTEEITAAKKTSEVIAGIMQSAKVPACWRRLLLP